MEAIAAIGGFAAIAQMADYGIRFAKTLNKLAARAGSTADDIARFSLQVKNFALTVRTVRFSISSHCDQYPDSDVVRYMAQHGVLDSVGEESLLVEKRLRVARERVAAMARGRLRLLMLIRWALAKAAILELCPEMESVKTGMNLLFTTMLLELNVARRDQVPEGAVEENRRLENECRELKRLIETHVSERERLKIRIRHLEIARGERPATAFAAPPIDYLSELGRDVVSDRIIPRATPLPPRTPPPAASRLDSGSSRETRRSTSARSRTVPSQSSTPPTPASSSRTRRSPPRPATSPRLEIMTPAPDEAAEPSTPPMKPETYLQRLRWRLRGSSGRFEDVTVGLNSTVDYNVITTESAARLGLSINAAEATGLLLADREQRPSVGSVTGEMELARRPETEGQYTAPIFRVRAEFRAVESDQPRVVLGNAAIQRMVRATRLNEKE